MSILIGMCTSCGGLRVVPGGPFPGLKKILRMKCVSQVIE